MSMSRLNFILELTRPNSLLCGATWEGRPLIRVICAGVYALQFTYHATPALDSPLPDLVTTLNFILGGLTHSQPYPGMCMYTHRGLKLQLTTPFLIGREALWILKVRWLSSSWG